MRTFLHITLPLSIPGIIAGTFLTFALAMSAFVAPLILGGGNVMTMTVLMRQSMFTTLNWPLGAAQSVALVLLVVAMLAIYRRQLAELGQGDRRMRYVGEGRFGSPLLGGYLVLFFLFLETPIIIIVLASFNDGPTVRFPPIGFSLQWYRELLHIVQDGSGTKPGLLKALWTSAGLGVVSMVGAIFAGVLAAYGIERYRFRGRALLRQALLLPLLFPQDRDRHRLAAVV